MKQRDCILLWPRRWPSFEALHPLPPIPGTSTCTTRLCLGEWPVPLSLWYYSHVITCELGHYCDLVPIIPLISERTNPAVESTYISTHLSFYLSLCLSPHSHSVHIFINIYIHIYAYAIMSYIWPTTKLFYISKTINKNIRTLDNFIFHPLWILVIFF